MLILQKTTANELNLELNPTISNPFWYFVWTLDDLNTPEVKLFIAADSSSSRFYTFTMDTTANPMKTGEWVLNIYELDSNDPNPDVSELTPSYTSKARIYKDDFPTDNFHTQTLSDDRID